MGVTPYNTHKYPHRYSMPLTHRAQSFQKTLTVRTWAVAMLFAGFIMAFNPLAAQSSVSPQLTGPNNSLTANPFFLLAGWMSAEYERRVNASVSLGGGFSYVDIGDNVYSSFELKGRLYPNERAMRGFEMGLSLGVTRLEFEDEECPITRFCDDNDIIRRKVTTPAVGLEFAYQWMIGTNRHTVIALGGGAKRFLASRNELHGTSRVIPTFRMAIGYAW
jgi:hypothetical protein